MVQIDLNDQLTCKCCLACGNFLLLETVGTMYPKQNNIAIKKEQGHQRIWKILIVLRMSSYNDYIIFY